MNVSDQQNVNSVHLLNVAAFTKALFLKIKLYDQVINNT